MQIVKKKNILFQTWHNIHHSYGIVSAFQLIHLYKKYQDQLEIYVTIMPYYNPAWKPIYGLYSDEYNKILDNLKLYTPGTHIDLIYRQTYPYNITLNNMPKVPKCVFYTSEFCKLDVSYFVAGNKGPINDKYIKKYLAKYNNIYFTSPSYWSSLGMVKYLPPSPSNARNRIITHGVDTSIFYKNDDARRSVRHKYGIADDEFLLLNIGAMTGNKGIILILQTVLAMITDSNPKYHNVKLLLKGTQDLYSTSEFIQSYFNNMHSNMNLSLQELHNLSSHIIFTSETLTFSDLNDLYNASDLYISPYIAEGFNLVPLEVLATSGHVLVPETGSTKEYIEDIYKHGGSSHITFVKSVVINDDGKCYNDIKLNDLIDSVKSLVDHAENSMDNIDNMDMINYIQTNYSWNMVADLLYKYFCDIIN
jgi:glycosyltransferase involved in cell wall biosynthesis